MVHFREVLFKKDFFALWSGQIISEFGDRLNQMALIALVYANQPGSVMALAKLLFFVVVPVFIIGPVAGVYVDRWDRKKVMIISDIVRGLLVLLIPIFIFLKLIMPIYIIVFLIFSTTRFFLPSKMALIPDIVAEDKLMVANSLSNTTRMIATMLGLAIAGLIVKWVGCVWGFYLDSLSYFLSAVLIVFITPRKKLPTVKEDIQITKDILEKTLRRDVRRELMEGFGYLVNRDKMRIVTGAIFMLMAGAGAIFCVIIVFVQEKFGSVTEALGFLGVFLGCGLFLGTVVYGKLCQAFSKIRSIFASFVLCGLFIGLFTLYTDRGAGLVTAGLLIMLVGAASAPIFICTNTLIHILVPDKVRGRIFSSTEVVIHLAFLIFMFLTANLAKHFSNALILFSSGITFAIIGIAGGILTRKEKY
ncbi:MAG: MFS transporter [Candidatus Omnitrophica bacterium]|nr:MFS transporter [Candidatus Omnitrophota bacterium]